MNRTNACPQMSSFWIAAAVGLLLSGLPTATYAQSYEVKVKTSDRSGAGTDSNVFLQMFGANEKWEQVRLNKYIEGNVMESNQTDLFSFPNKRLAKIKDVGPIVKLNVMSDGKYPGSDWHLESIEVTYTPAAGEKVVTKFRCDQWITGEEKTEDSRRGVDLVSEK